MNLISANLRLTDYTNRVFGVIKEKYGLKDKSEAINRFAEMFGDDFVEKDVSEEYAKEVVESCNRHFKKYGLRKMSIKELDELCGVS